MKDLISTAEPERDSTPRDQCRILVIDDEEFIRTLIERMLEQLHCTGIFASDGQHGIDLFEKEQANIDIVLLDLSMPVMDGHTCLSHIRTLNEEIPVILMSGYSEQEIKTRFDSESNLDFIQKPFGFEDIKKKLRQYAHINPMHVP